MIKGLILAGGPQTRLLPIMVNTPKPLLPVGNLPLILFQIELFKKAGITEIILSLAHQPRRIRDVLGQGHRFGVTIRYMVESTPVGTAGAFHRIGHLVDDTTVVLNGDVLVQTELKNLIERHRKAKSVLSVGTTKVERPHSYGLVEVGSDSRVSRYRERPKGESVRARTINAGVYVIEPEILEMVSSDEPSYFERHIFPALIEQDRGLHAFPVHGYWADITRPERYLRANLDFLERRVLPPRFAALANENPAPVAPQAEIDSVSVTGEGCVVKKGVRIECCVIGAKCLIEPGVQLRESVVWPGCHIQKNAFVSGSVLGRNCLVGEAAHVTKGSLLGDKSTIASFSRL